MKILIYVSSPDKSDFAVLFGGMFTLATRVEVALLHKRS